MCESFEIEDHLNTEQIQNMPKSSTPLPSVFESDDSEIEDFISDVFERGRCMIKKPQKSNCSTYNGSCAMDTRLEVTVELQAEITLRRLISSHMHSLMQNINSPPTLSDIDQELPMWPAELLIPWQPQSQTNAKNGNMLVNSFNNLFKNLQMQSTTNIEHILQLWLTLSSNSDEKFNPNSVPFFPLSLEAINSLISSIAWSTGLSLRCWCSALQTLTLICNTTHTSNSKWSENYGVYCRIECVVKHPDFVQMLNRLLSGTGLVFSDKGLVSDYFNFINVTFQKLMLPKNIILNCYY